MSWKFKSAFNWNKNSCLADLKVLNDIERKKEAKTERGIEKRKYFRRPGQVHFGIYLFVCLWCFFGAPSLFAFITWKWVTRNFFKFVICVFYARKWVQFKMSSQNLSLHNTLFTWIHTYANVWREESLSLSLSLSLSYTHTHTHSNTHTHTHML